MGSVPCGEGAQRRVREVAPGGGRHVRGGVAGEGRRRGGADEFDTFGEPADVQDGYLPGDPADPTTMLDPSSGMGATL